MSRLFIDASRERLSIGIEVGTTWRAFDAIEGRHDQVLLESIRSLCVESGSQLVNYPNVSSLTVREVLRGCGSLYRVYMPWIWFVPCKFCLLINCHYWRPRVRGNVSTRS